MAKGIRIRGCLFVFHYARTATFQTLEKSEPRMDTNQHEWELDFPSIGKRASRQVAKVQRVSNDWKLRDYGTDPFGSVAGEKLIF